MSNNTGGSQMGARKKPGPVHVDLMRPGNGTPWEDRGSSGGIVAYFKTVAKSMTAPGLLMDHIRRPETTSDSQVFAIVSASMWVISIIIWNVYWYYKILLPNDGKLYDVDSTYYYCLTAVLQTVLVGGGIFLWLRNGPKFYRSLGGAELKGATPSLIQNCFNYAMGPSLLALLGIILVCFVGPQYAMLGWGLAFAWIIFDLIVAGKRRFYLKGASAIINAILLAVAVVAITAVFYYILSWLWTKLDMGGFSPRAPVKPLVKPS